MRCALVAETCQRLMQLNTCRRRESAIAHNFAYALAQGTDVSRAPAEDMHTLGKQHCHGRFAIRTGYAGYN